MDKLTQILVFFVLTTGIIASYNTLNSSNELSIKQIVNASLAVDTECIDRSKINYASCGQVYEPVCGCDGRTYWTECHAQREGVISWEKGNCRQLAKPTASK